LLDPRVFFHTHTSSDTYNNTNTQKTKPNSRTASKNPPNQRTVRKKRIKKESKRSSEKGEYSILQYKKLIRRKRYFRKKARKKSKREIFAASRIRSRKGEVVELEES